MRCLWSLIPIFIGYAAQAQWDVPVHLEMTGTQDSDRQVRGLADPLSTGAAVSLDAARARTMAFANATGTTYLEADLAPAPAALAIGMSVTIVPAQANHAGATLDLNGHGPVPLVKYGNIPLDSADLAAGMPAQLIYDGSNFLVISSTYRNCPPGMVPISSQHCISSNLEAQGLTFYEAMTFCVDRGARLCTMNEWMQACRNNPWFLETVVVAEWVDHAANNIGDAKIIGIGSDGTTGTTTVPECIRGGTLVPTGTRGARCCANR